MEINKEKIFKDNILSCDNLMKEIDNKVKRLHTKKMLLVKRKIKAIKDLREENEI